MEIPIYLTFKEFEENYPEDLKKWLKHYEDSEEIEFLEEVEREYREAFNEATIEVFERGEECPFTEKICLWDLFRVINSRLEAYTENENIEVKNEDEYYSLIPKVFNYSSSDNFKLYDKEDPNKIIYEDYYYIYRNDFLKCQKFLTIVDFIGDYILEFDEIKFKNFGFAKRRIYEFIERRREELTEERTENNTREGRNKSDIIAVLHHTGIIDFLRDKYPNATQRGIARFFEFITNGYITERSNHSQFTSDKESAKYPKNLKSEINNLLKDYFADANA